MSVRMPAFPRIWYGLRITAGPIAAVGLITNSQIVIVGVMVVEAKYRPWSRWPYAALKRDGSLVKAACLRWSLVNRGRSGRRVTGLDRASRRAGAQEASGWRDEAIGWRDEASGWRDDGPLADLGRSGLVGLSRRHPGAVVYGFPGGEQALVEFVVASFEIQISRVPVRVAIRSREHDRTKPVGHVVGLFGLVLPCRFGPYVRRCGQTRSQVTSG